MKVSVFPFRGRDSDSFRFFPPANYLLLSLPHAHDRSLRFFFSLIRFFRINLFMILMVVYGRYLLETCVPAHAFVV